MFTRTKIVHQSKCQLSLLSIAIYDVDDWWHGTTFKFIQRPDRSFKVNLGSLITDMSSAIPKNIIFSANYKKCQKVRLLFEKMDDTFSIYLEQCSILYHILYIYIDLNIFNLPSAQFRKLRLNFGSKFHSIQWNLILSIRICWPNTLWNRV